MIQISNDSSRRVLQAQSCSLQSKKQSPPHQNVRPNVNKREVKSTVLSVLAFSEMVNMEVVKAINVPTYRSTPDMPDQRRRPQMLTRYSDYTLSVTQTKWDLKKDQFILNSMQKCFKHKFCSVVTSCVESVLTGNV